jgi:hypothetical protein
MLSLLPEGAKIDILRKGRDEAFPAVNMWCDAVMPS